METQTQLPKSLYSIKCDLWHNCWQGLSKSGEQYKLTFSIRSAERASYKNVTAKMNSERRYWRYNNSSSAEHQELVERHVKLLGKHCRVSKVVRFGYGRGNANASMSNMSAIWHLDTAYLWWATQCYQFDLDEDIVSENQKDITMNSKNKSWRNNVVGSCILYGPSATQAVQGDDIWSYLLED